jgi:hypothetical protein
MIVQQFAPPTWKLIDMDVRDARHILAARSWCILRGADLDPMPRVQGYVLSGLVALRFGLLMETITQIWPEPFAIHRPCCSLVSIDEYVLIHAIRLAAIGHRPKFDTLLCEMLSGESRDLLFTRAGTLYGD